MEEERPGTHCDLKDHLARPGAENVIREVVEKHSYIENRSKDARNGETTTLGGYSIAV